MAVHEFREKCTATLPTAATEAAAGVQDADRTWLSVLHSAFPVNAVASSNGPVLTNVVSWTMKRPCQVRAGNERVPPSRAGRRMVGVMHGITPEPRSGSRRDDPANGEQIRHQP